MSDLHSAYTQLMATVAELYRLGKEAETGRLAAVKRLEALQAAPPAVATDSRDLEAKLARALRRQFKAETALAKAEITIARLRAAKPAGPQRMTGEEMAARRIAAEVEERRLRALQPPETDPDDRDDDAAWRNDPAASSKPPATPAQRNMTVVDLDDAANIAVVKRLSVEWTHISCTGPVGAMDATAARLEASPEHTASWRLQAFVTFYRQHGIPALPTNPDCLDIFTLET